MIKPTRDTDLARFWAKVDKTASCWLWTASVKPSGYGQFQVNRKVVYAHRYAWEAANGPIPEGDELDHKCRVRICVNPAHLRPTTRKQNMENKGGAQKNSGTGILGVSWSRHRRKWHAQVRHNTVLSYSKYFDTIEEAEAAVVAKRLELFTHNDMDRTAA